MGLFGDILSTVGKVAVDAVKNGKAEEIIKEHEKELTNHEERN